MSTFLLDYEGGNDANDGLTFANRWKTISDGATAARIAPGDTIKIMGSPAPTSLAQNATWTGGGQLPTQTITSSTNATPIVITKAAHGLASNEFVIVYGHTTNTNANGTWKITVIDANTFSLNGSTGNGVGGASGNFRPCTNYVVQLTSAVTAEIASYKNRGEGAAAWTASASVTTSQNTTDFKCGDVSDSIAIAAGFTTGLAAYFATGALNLSGYQQVSFWIKQTAGTVGAASSASLTLCSDTAGATVVNTVNIPAIPSLNYWTPFTVDLGAALGASIQSIGFVVNTDNGAQTFLINNVMACKASASADSLSLTSLISKNKALISRTGVVFSQHGTDGVLGTFTAHGLFTGAWVTVSGVTQAYGNARWQVIVLSADTFILQDASWASFNGADVTGDIVHGKEAWYAIQSIVGTRVMLDRYTQSIPTNTNMGQRGYSGATETATLYKRETIKVSTAATLTTKESGTSGSPITYSGGWDRTDMSTQTLETWFDGQGLAAVGLVSSLAYLNFTKINLVRFNSYGYSFDNSTNLNITDAQATACIAFMVASQNSADINLLGTTISEANGTQFSGEGLMFSASGGGTLYVEELFALDTGGDNAYGVQLAAPISIAKIKSLIAKNNMYGFRAIGNHNIGGGLTEYNQSAAVYALNTNDPATIKNLTVNDATDIAPGGVAAQTPRVIFENYDGVQGSHRHVFDGGVVATEVTVRHTASGVAWSLAPTSASRLVTNPIYVPICLIAVNADTLVTVKAWMRRSNTGLTVRLTCPGGQLQWLPNDITSSMTAIADTWEELTITFTPREAGVVEIRAEAYGGTAYTGYVDDITVSQA